jgi:hypothetical protein
MGLEIYIWNNLFLGCNDVCEKQQQQQQQRKLKNSNNNSN